MKINEKLCSKLSCNKYTASRFCTPETKTHYVRVSVESSYDAVSQPSCSRTEIDPTYSQDNTCSVAMPQLKYNNGKYMLVPEFMTNYLEITFYRSRTVYEKRVNDMPTGFSRVKDDVNVFGCGWTYENNSTYCHY